MSVGISLGWNCYAAGIGVQLKLRKQKKDGYKTCPFDIGITNYPGVVKCIEDDFQHFTDSNHLKIIYLDRVVGGLSVNDRLIYNDYYKFIFNHESPNHANLHNIEGWQGGSEHFVANDFLNFKRRYDTRIQNFRDYLNSGEHITFILTRVCNDVTELKNVLAEKYPNITYDIHMTGLQYPDQYHVIQSSFELLQLTPEQIQHEITA